jgi:hypothetical protein
VEEEELVGFQPGAREAGGIAVGEAFAPAEELTERRVIHFGGRAGVAPDLQTLEEAGHEFLQSAGGGGGWRRGCGESTLLSAAHAVEVSESWFSSHLEVLGHWTAVAEPNEPDVGGKIGARGRQALLRELRCMAIGS